MATKQAKKKPGGAGDGMLDAVVGKISPAVEEMKRMAEKWGFSLRFETVEGEFRAVFHHPSGNLTIGGKPSKEPAVTALSALSVLIALAETAKSNRESQARKEERNAE